MTHEEKDIELIKQTINTKVYDGIEYFHTYKGVKYYRHFINTAQGGHTGMPHLVHIKYGETELVEDSYKIREIAIDKLNRTQ